MFLSDNAASTEVSMTEDDPSEQRYMLIMPTLTLNIPSKTF